MNKIEKVKLTKEVLALITKAVESGEDVRLWNYIKNRGKGFTGFSLRTGNLSTDGTWCKVKIDEFIGENK